MSAHLRYHLLTPLGRVCRWLADVLEEWSHVLIRCPDCGRSRYYGKACK